jgi:hypothetical protein
MSCRKRTPPVRQTEGLKSCEVSTEPTGCSTLPFDAAEALDTQEAQAELLDEALASGNAKVVAAALGMIARAKGEADERLRLPDGGNEPC